MIDLLVDIYRMRARAQTIIVVYLVRQGDGQVLPLGDIC